MDKICFKSTKGPAAIGPYCSAVVYGDTVYMSGVIGVESGGGQARGGRHAGAGEAGV